MAGDDDWKYGDVWKDADASREKEDEEISFVEVLRGDTGRGFDDSLMLEMIGYLGSRGIRATYDSFSLGLEPAAIKTYVLKVETGKEREALLLLEEWQSGNEE